MRLSEYGTSLSGMMAAQLAMSATKQNISNLQTEGYVRQKVNFTQVGSSSSFQSAQQAGYGVTVSGIERMTDDIKKEQYNAQVSEQAYYEYRATNLSSVESLLGGTDDTTSLSALMDNFLNAWGEVAKSPNDQILYNTLISETTKFTTQLNNVVENISTLQTGMSKDVQQNVDEWNRLTETLAETNRKIGQAGANPPNSLLDERDQLLSKMSKYAKIDVSYEAGNPNVASVRMNGVLAVSGNENYNVELASQDGTLQLQLNGATIEAGGGTIQAAQDILQSDLTGYMDKLNSFAAALIDKVNSVTNTEFFTGTGAADIKVNESISNDTTLLNVTAAVAGTVAGLADEIVDGNLTYSEYLSDFVVGVASDVNIANSYQTVHSDLLTSLQEDVLAVEGVNMDEEMVNLMMYQNYFSANSKAIKVLDDMYETLFSIL